MFKCLWRGFSSSWCTLYKSFHYKKRLIHFFDRAWILSYRSCNGGDPNRTPIEFLNDSRKNTIVHFIKSIFIYTQCVHTMDRDFFVDRTCSFYLCKVTHSTQQ